MSREHPLLMKGPLVVATLAGRKWQTRRLVTPGTSTVEGKPAAREWSVLDFARAMAVDHALAERGIGVDAHGAPIDGALVVPYKGNPIGRTSATVRPRVRPGDALYIRETWQTGSALDDEAPSMLAAWARAGGVEPCGPVRYAADGLERDEHMLAPGSHYGEHWGRGRPGIHLPRWASRLVLPVESVRCERVDAISEPDALAEGVIGVPFQPEDHPPAIGYVLGKDDGKCTLHPNAYQAFWAGWDAINGHRDGAAFLDRPWTWVYQWPAVQP
jgi:hypothetical protein